jgi:DNA-binding GntR family transcriptional regulator
MNSSGVFDNTEPVQETGRTKKPSLDRTTLRDRIREFLVDAILNGDYKAGDRLVETRVAQQLGVSQGAVREALRELEWMGFLETYPYSGTFVKEHTLADLQEIYPVRAALEALGARLAAPRLSDAQLDELERLVEEMVSVSRAGDQRRMVEINYAFHQMIIRASGNSVLIRSWSMFQFSYWTMFSTVELHNQLVDLAERHYWVLEALRSRDSERAAQAMHEHIIEMVNLVGKHRGQT